MGIHRTVNTEYITRIPLCFRKTLRVKTEKIPLFIASSSQT